MNDLDPVSLAYLDDRPVRPANDRFIHLNSDPLGRQRKKLQKMVQADPFGNFVRLAVYHN